VQFGFDNTKDTPSKTDLTDKDDLDEIKKIAGRLNPNETVLAVAKQSRIKPDGSITTPCIIFATDKRLIIRDSSTLGITQNIEDITYTNIISVSLQEGVFSSSIMLRTNSLCSVSGKKLNWIAFAKGSNEGKIDAISKDKAKKIVEIIKKGIEKAEFAKSYTSTTTIFNDQHISASNELVILSKLKAQGIISDTEFQTLRQELMKKH
jgi:hypothetical protein